MTHQTFSLEGTKVYGVRNKLMGIPVKKSLVFH